MRYNRSPHIVTLGDMVKSVRRELEMRQKFFPRRVADGRMEKNKADREILVFQKLLQHLERELEEEKRGAADRARWTG